MIPAEVLEIAPRGALNLHGSLLPRYRGRAPVNWVLVEGESETGVSLHYMVAKPDAGDLVDQERVAIEPADTAFTLYGKLETAAGRLLDRALPALAAGTARPIPHGSVKRFLSRRAQAGRRPHRLELARPPDLRSGARRHPPLSRRVHDSARREAPGLVGACPGWPS